MTATETLKMAMWVVVNSPTQALFLINAEGQIVWKDLGTYIGDTSPRPNNPEPN